MRSSELLAKVKSLSPAQRRKFVRAVLAMKEDRPSRSSARAERVVWPDVEARARRVTAGRILPNLVLLEREEANF